MVDKHKCTEFSRRLERLAEWEREQERKYGKGWEHNPFRPVSVIHDYPPPEGVRVVLSGSKTRDDSISLNSWLKKQKEKPASERVSE